MTESKYIHCYKYLPFDEGALRVLTDSTIKFTCPTDFNDPFDCRPAYCEQSLQRVAETRRDLVHRIGRKQGLSPAKRLQMKGKIAKQIENYVGSSRYVDAILKSVGVVSLSVDPTNVLMWSHYADFHRGFVVEFKIPLVGSMQDAQKGGENLIPLEVSYSQQRPQIRFGIDSEQEVLHKMVFTKAQEWKYEQERRVIDHRRGPGVHQYNRNKLLQCVVAGIRMPKENRTRLAAVVESLKSAKGLEHVTMYEAKASDKEYKIRIPSHPYWC